MRENEHTPGPWTPTEGEIESADGVHIATVYEHPGCNHARLITAAPETARQRDKLLGAATKIVDATDDTCRRDYCIMDDGEGIHEALEALRAAIASAKGEGSS